MHEPAPSVEKPSLPGHPPAPLLLPALGLLGGIAFDGWFGAGALPYFFGLLLTLLLLLWPRGRRGAARVSLVLAAFCIGGLSHAGQMRRLPADHVLRYTAGTPVLARIRGVVLTEPRLAEKTAHLFSPWWPPTARTTFLAEVEAVQTVAGWAVAGGTVKVSVKEPVLNLAVGDRVELFGWCYRPLPPANPGQFDWAEYDRRRGVFVGFTCDQAECVRRLESPSPTVLTLWDRLRRRTRELLLDQMLASGGPEATLLDTMVLGHRTAIEPALNEAFMRIGCTHYLAVSGSNIGMIAVFIWGVGRIVGVSGRGCALAVVVASVLYCLVADPRPPIVRATVVSLAICMGLLLGRPPNLPNGLALAAFVILTVQPTDLRAVDFQLSFSAMFAITYISPLFMEVARRLRPAVLGRPDNEADLFIVRPSASLGARVWRRLESWFWWTLSASLATWLISIPITLLYFDRCSPWGWLTTLLLFPFVLVLTVASFAKLLCALVWPTVGSLLTTPVQWLAGILIQVVEWLDHLPQLPRGAAAVPWWLAGLGAAVLIAWAGRNHWRQGRWILRVLAGLLALGSVGWGAWPRGDGRLSMTVLSVGHGMAIVLELPDGRSVLYDAGTLGAYDPGASVIVPFLRHRGIRRLEAVFLSHPNLDHFSGLPTVLESLPTGTVYMTPYFEPLSADGKPSRLLLDELRTRGHPVVTVHHPHLPFILGDVSFEFLWPPPDLGTGVDANETSLVVRVSFAGRSILLTGDIGTLGQARLAADGHVQAEVLALPHHGSVRHNTGHFVAAVGAQVLISSTSIRSGEVGGEMDLLIGGRRSYNTADHGAVTVVLDREEIRVRTLLNR